MSPNLSDRMDTHKNARLTPKGREDMVRAVARAILSGIVQAQNQAEGKLAARSPVHKVSKPFERQFPLRNCHAMILTDRLTISYVIVQRIDKER